MIKCNRFRVTLILILCMSILLAAGIFLIILGCIQSGNWYPLFSLLAWILGITLPLLFGDCSSESPASSPWDDAGDSEGVYIMIRWFLLGLLLILGYATPIELFRGNLLTQTSTLCITIGGTATLMAILVFFRAVYFVKNPHETYLF